MMMRKSLSTVLFAVFIGTGLVCGAQAADDGAAPVKTTKMSAKKKTYKEGEFAMMVRNKNKKQVAELLGEPVSKMQGGSKPSGADAIAGGIGRLDPARRDNVEIWYYKNLVSYDPKHTFSKVELTFLNDRCQNVAYVNER